MVLLFLEFHLRKRIIWYDILVVQYLKKILSLYIDKIDTKKDPKIEFPCLLGS